MVSSSSSNSWNVHPLCFFMGKDILLLFYSIGFFDLVRQPADLSTSQAYGYGVIRQMLNFLRCNLKNRGYCVPCLSITVLQHVP